MRLIPCMLLATSVVLLAGCSSARSLTEHLNPYRIDIRQGNYVDQAMVAKLQKGMTREQVRFVLGTPLLVDAFHPDRWDYVYRFQKGHGEPSQRRISVVFVDDRLDHVEGDVTAAQGETGAAPAMPERVIDLGTAPADDKAEKK